MKRTLLLIVFTYLFAFSGKAQVATELSGLISPYGMTIDGTTMYLCADLKVYSVDLTQTPLTAQLLVTPSPSGYIAGMDVYNNKLYFSYEGLGKISYVDLTASTPTVVDVITGIGTPEGITVVGSDLYYITFNSPVGIYKIDLTQATPTPTLVLSGTFSSGFGLDSIGTTLYYTDFNGSSVYSLDTTQATPTPTFLASIPYATGIKAVGNTLYIAAYLDNTIYEYNLNTMAVSTLVTGTGNPVGIDYYNSNLYMTDQGSGAILSTNATPLATETMVKNTIAIYPNPTTDFISITNLQEATTYEIYSVDGKQVLAGTIAPDAKIDVQTLAQGMYVVKTANGATQRIVKL